MMQNIEDNNIINKMYRTTSKIFMIMEFIIILFFFFVIRCSCNIPQFNPIPPVIILIAEIILYFVTRNRVDSRKKQIIMLAIYIFLLIIFSLVLVAIRNPHSIITP